MIAAPTKETALNIGSGASTQANATFLWVDAEAWPVDVKADVRSLPFRDGHFTHVHCSHLIEHVPLDAAIPALRELRRVLHPDGVLYVSGPDMDRAEAAGSSEWVFYTVNGGHRDGWEHRWVCTVPKLRDLLTEAGFVPTWAKSVPAGWPPNTHLWPLEFEARFLCRRDDFPWPRSFPSGMEILL